MNLRTPVSSHLLLLFLLVFWWGAPVALLIAGTKKPGCMGPGFSVEGVRLEQSRRVSPLVLGAAVE